jgi:hypothetical protein
MTIYIPTRQRIILCKETTAGAAVTAAGILGPTSGLSSNWIGSLSTEDADLGMGINTFSATPNSGRYATISWSDLLRPDATSLFVLMGMLGAGSDSVAAGTPNVHTGSIVQALPITYTAYHDTGNQNEYYPFPYATGTSVSLAWSPTQSPMFSSQLTAHCPNATGASPPTISQRVVGTEAKNANATYTLQSHTAGTLYPSADVVSGSISFARGANPVVTSGADAATDIAPLGLVMSGTMELVYRGDTANSPRDDWRNWGYQGTSANKNKIVWAIDANNSIEIDWWPMTLSRCDVADGGDVLHVSFDFTASNDLATSNVATPTGTAPAAVIVKNALAGAMS